MHARRLNGKHLGVAFHSITSVPLWPTIGLHRCCGRPFHSPAVHTMPGGYCSNACNATIVMHTSANAKFADLATRLCPACCAVLVFEHPCEAAAFARGPHLCAYSVYRPFRTSRSVRTCAVDVQACCAQHSACALKARRARAAATTSGSPRTLGRSRSASTWRRWCRTRRSSRRPPSSGAPGPLIGPACALWLLHRMLPLGPEMMLQCRAPAPRLAC